jgi:hypothetical protein
MFWILVKPLSTPAFALMQKKLNSLDRFQEQKAHC